MSSQNIESPQFDILGDLKAVKSLGYLNDFPLAIVKGMRNIEKYQIFFGWNGVSLYEKDVVKVLDVKTLILGSSFYTRDEVHFEKAHIADWEKGMAITVEALQFAYGLKVNCKCVLRGLYLLATGYGVPISNAEAFGGSFASIVLDLPIEHRACSMVLRATRDGDSEAFELGAEVCRALHWWHDTSVTIEPISFGVRAVLIYDVTRDRPEPIYFLPGTQRHRIVQEQLQAHVQSHTFRRLARKTGYLPLVRMLFHSYGEAGMAIQPACHELGGRVILSYEQRMKEAVESKAGLDVLFELREEGKDLDRSLGSEGILHIFTKRYIRDFKALETALRDRLSQLQSAYIQGMDPYHNISS